MARITLHEYCSEARQLIESRAYDAAIAICRHILKRYPKHVETYRLLGEACLEKGELNEAADIFKRVLNADPENFAAHAGLGFIYQERQQLAQAIWHMERAFELAPNNEETRNALRRLYGQRDGVEPARIKLNKVALARLYSRGGQYRQAIDEFNRWLEIEPNRMDIRVSLAETLWRDARREQAAEAAREILKTCPDCLKAILLLGAVQMDKGRTEEGKRILARARMLDPENRVAGALFGEDSPLPEQPVLVPRAPEPLPVPAAQALPEGEAPSAPESGSESDMAQAQEPQQSEAAPQEVAAARETEALPPSIPIMAIPAEACVPAAEAFPIEEAGPEPAQEVPTAPAFGIAPETVEETPQTPFPLQETLPAQETRAAEASAEQAGGRAEPVPEAAAALETPAVPEALAPPQPAAPTEPAETVAALALEAAQAEKPVAVGPVSDILAISPATEPVETAEAAQAEATLVQEAEATERAVVPAVTERAEVLAAPAPEELLVQGEVAAAELAVEAPEAAVTLVPEETPAPCAQAVENQLAAGPEAIPESQTAAAVAPEEPFVTELAERIEAPASALEAALATETAAAATVVEVDAQQAEAAATSAPEAAPAEVTLQPELASEAALAPESAVAAPVEEARADAPVAETPAEAAVAPRAIAVPETEVVVTQPVEPVVESIPALSTQVAPTAVEGEQPEAVTGLAPAALSAARTPDVALYEQQLQQNPKDERTRLSLARVYRDQEQVEQALEHYRALVKAKAETLAEAIEDMESIVASRPGNLAAHELLADLYAKNGQLQKAMERYRWLVQQVEQKPT